jgi:DNA-binding IscR family transcriptional regulator
VPDGELIDAADIAHAISSWESYQAKVMQLLVRAGLVTSELFPRPSERTSLLPREGVG